MRQNPFSLYDFLGYVFPGALSLVLIYFFTKLESVSSLTSIYTESEFFLKNINVSGNLSLLEETVILTIIAYVIGHIVAYISSITVEKFSTWTYDYPSVFLLQKVQPYNYWIIRDKGNKKWYKTRSGISELIWRVLIGIFLFPISICTIVLGKLLGMKEFFVKMLDKTLTDTIKANKEKLAESLGIQLQGDEDFHRLKYHYEYEKQNTHVQKLDNYVALYGFLRAMTFIANCATVWITCRYLIPTIKPGNQVDWHLVLLFVFIILITYIFFMSFMKFYRRFTLESLMCLVIDSSFKVIPQMPYSYVTLPDQSQQIHHRSNANSTNYSRSDNSQSNPI